MQYFGEVFTHLDPVAFKTAFQVALVCYCAVWIWRRIVGTQAERLVKGVMVLIGLCALSYFLGFSLVTSILQPLIPIAVMALVIIFQPEIRRGLGYLGRMNTFRIDFSLADREIENSKLDITHIIAAVKELSKTRVGALIVVEPPEGERDYLSPGTPVNADISSNLLLSIFFPKSPLHDGAVVIRRNKIVAAGVILPMTDDPKLSFKYGTRHRAALGLSEIYDGLCIVVSEETGAISAANRGMLVRYNTADELADPLSYIYLQGTDGKTLSPLNSFLQMIGRNKPSATIEGATSLIGTGGATGATASSTAGSTAGSTASSTAGGTTSGTTSSTASGTTSSTASGTTSSTASGTTSAPAAGTSNTAGTAAVATAGSKPTILKIKSTTVSKMKSIDKEMPADASLSSKSQMESEQPV